MVFPCQKEGHSETGRHNHKGGKTRIGEEAVVNRPGFSGDCFS